MLSISDLLTAAKRGAGIPSNYRLARVLDLTDSAVQRWSTGRGVPDDAQAHRMAMMAGMDPGYVIAAVRALREKDPTLRAVWEDMAARLLAQTGDGGTPPEGGPGGDGDDDDGHTPGGLIGGIGSALGATGGEPDSVRYVNLWRRGDTPRIPPSTHLG
jgi:hypothetical protein